MIEKSIRNWILAPFVLLLLPFLIFGAVISLKNYITERADIINHQEHIVLLGAENITQFFNEQSMAITSMLQLSHLPSMNNENKQDFLSTFQASTRDKEGKSVFHTLSFFNDSGKELVRVSETDLIGDDDLRNISNKPEFIIPYSLGGKYFGPVYFNDNTGEPFMKIGIPSTNLRTMKREGVIIAEISLKTLWRRIASMKIRKNGTAFLTDHTGRVIAHKNRSIVLRNTHFAAPDKPIVMAGVSNEKSIIAAKKIPLGEHQLYFLTELPTSEAFQHINTSLLLFCVFFSCTFLVGFILAVGVIREIIRPIETLAQKAQKISDGDLSQKAETKHVGELGELALSFNTMTSKLVKTIQALGHEKDFVRNVIESLTQPFYVIDVKDYSIKLANSAAKFGSADKLSTCYKLTHKRDTPCKGDDHPCPILEISKTKKPVVVEHVHEDDNNNKKIIEIYGYPIFDEQGNVIQIIEYNIDVTEKRNLEIQLQQSQKLEAIGVLTGGVAHDFNNLLTTIIGYSQLALMQSTLDDSSREYIESVFEASNKAASLIEQLMAFSRRQMMEMKVVDLNELITNLMKMLERLIGEEIKIRYLNKGRHGNIKADPGQVEQILMNLVVNARDAMSEGGELFLESDIAELDEEYCKSHPNITPGSYVFFSVTDTGIGIPAEIKDKIFDPFFTTKDQGEGTGLGLATVYGIVKQLKGHIYVYSELNCGTTFKIYFPQATDEEVDAIKKVTAEREKMVFAKAINETIFIVDDELSIRKLIRDTLQPIGYKVFEASCGKDALKKSKDFNGEIDLLLTDVIMPNMNGRDLATSLEPMYPDMKVMYMSGYTDDIIAQKGIIKQGVNFIQKPLVPTLLINKIREVLDD